MAEFLPPVILEIQAKATQAIASMQTVNGELDKMEVKALKAGGSLDVMTKASRYSGVALAGLVGIFGTVAAVGIKSALTMADSQAKLKTAVQDTGVSFANFKPYMDSSVESMAKLGFRSDDTVNALAQMTAATRDPRVALSSLSTVADLAAFKHESLAQAADTVSRAAMGQARGLADLGLALNKTIPKGATLAQIEKDIADRTHGAADAAAKADPWKVLTAQFQLMTEQIGNALMPAFLKITNWIINTGLPALKNIAKWIKDHKTLFIEIGTVLAALWVAPKIDKTISTIQKLAKAYEALGTAATVAAGEETAAGVAGATAAAGGLGAFSALLLEVAPYLALAGMAYNERNVPKQVVGGIKNFGIAGATGGMIGGGGTSTPPTAKTVMVKDGVGIVVENKDIPKYLKQGYSYGPGGGPTSKTSTTGKPNITPKVPSLAADMAKTSAASSKKTSLKTQAKQKISAPATSTNLKVNLDSKTIAKAVASHAAHGSAMGASPHK
jgi:hypothetical protein